MGLGELLSARANEVDMRALVQNQARGLDGVAQALHAGDASGAEGCAVHDECVELHSSVAGEKAAASGVEGGIVFHGSDGGLDSIQSGAAAFEDAPAFLERVKHALFVRIEQIGGDVPGATVDKQDRGTIHSGKGDCTVSEMRLGVASPWRRPGR